MIQTFRKFFDAKRLRQAYKSVFRNDESGLLVLHDLLRYTHVFQPSYTAGDTHATAVREGQRDVGLYLLRVLGYKESDAQEVLDEQRNYLVTNDIHTDHHEQE